MTLPAAIDVMAVAATGALLALRFAVADRGSDRSLRPFAWMAIGSMIFALTDSFATLAVPDAVVAWSGKVALVAAAIHAIGWIAFLAAESARSMSRLERTACVGLGVMGGSALVPGLATAGTITRRPVEWLGIVQADIPPTVWGELLYVTLLVTLLGLAARSLLDYRRARRPRHLAYGASLAALAGCGVNDALVSSGVYPGLYVLSFGLLTIVVSVAGVDIAAFVTRARELDVLSSRLERAADERSRQLVEAQEQLRSAEKLAVVGQMSAAVAHEINTPSAAILANLEYLRGALQRDGALPGDAADALDESKAATRRIAEIVRELLDASRMGESRETRAVSLPLGRCLRQAAREARARLPSGVEVEVDAPGPIHVLGDAGVVEQILVNLLVNAGQAAEGAGRTRKVRVRARERAEDVEVEVSDDGTGIPQDARELVFQPFFTTKGGHGTGLGLAVSRDLARALGGGLEVGASGEQGTTMALRLPRGEARARVSTAPPEQAASRRMLRALVIDDEPLVRRALARALRHHVQVEAVEGPSAALDRLAQPDADFDVVLCDVMMPDGGGAGFLERVRTVRPALAARTIFMTGGATTTESRAFVTGLATPVLRKPIDMAALLRALDEVTAAADAGVLAGGAQDADGAQGAAAGDDDDGDGEGPP